MYTLKGFMSMPSLALDGKNKVADFGEFSTYCQTFTRDMRNYAITAQPDVELFVTKCIDEMENRINPSASFRANVLAFGQWIFNQHIGGLIPPNRNKPAFVQSIQQQFPNMTAVSVGEILESETIAGRYCPDYVQWKMLDGINQYQLTIWFSDASFRTQYDEFEIFIIPPVQDINNLINTKVNVYNLIIEQSQDWVVNQIQEITGDLPHTALYPYKLTWHDPNDFNAVMPTTWTAVIYGAAGYDSEAVKDKIRDYIAENSDYDKWNGIYPDLYAETEFAIFPMWDKLALQPNSLQVGIYSSMVRNVDVRTHVKTFIPSGYTQSGGSIEAYMEKHLYNGVAFYRSISYGILGNPNNKDGLLDLPQLYPDINFELDSLDPDYGRMTVESQELSRRFNAALDVARRFNPTNPLEVGYSRMVRRGMYFVAFNYRDYNYVILTRYSFNKVKGIDNDRVAAEI